MRGGSMLTLTMLTRGSGITSANFEGGGIKTCADNADTGRGGNLGKLREGLKKNGLFHDIDQISFNTHPPPPKNDI